MPKSKYGSKWIVIDGVPFQSKAEAKYYQELKLRKKAKQIADYSLQPKFTLLESFVDNTGKKQRAITYTADFKIIHNDGTIEITDIKGMVTQQYAIRKKLFLHRYPEYIFTEVKAK